MIVVDSLFFFIKRKVIRTVGLSPTPKKKSLFLLLTSMLLLREPGLFLLSRYTLKKRTGQRIGFRWLGALQNLHRNDPCIQTRAYLLSNRLSSSPPCVCVVLNQKRKIQNETDVAVVEVFYSFSCMHTYSSNPKTPHTHTH